ncbi:MAG: toxin-activating lysine-acyltransferase [Parvularcula sp.]|nr:toxin-activating lysine-acyltransferase [Parvularcula sp.]
MPDVETKAFRAFKDDNAYAALGRAVSYLMTKPNFKDLKFGFWSRTLVGQINRKHYFFTSDGKNIVGFVGWAFVDEGMAKAWLEGSADFNSVDCVNGECMVINAWAADTNAVNRFNLREIRHHLVGRKAAYAKRFYKNGRVRPLRVGITDLVESHIEKQA